MQYAGVVRQVAQTLAGGPRYQTTIDPQTGAVTRTAVPMSKTDIGLAIALTALSGGLAGLSARGPNAVGEAAGIGLQQGEKIAQQRQQVQQQQDQQAQQDYQNQVSTLTRKAAAYESNSRAVLNTSQAERYGVDSLKDAVSINSPLLSSYQDAGAVMDNNISQDALQAGIQSGKYDPTREIAIPDGFTNINGRYEQTFSVVNNPSAKVPLTNDQAQAFANAGIPGWTQFKNAKIPDGYEVPGTMLATANAQLQAIGLMKSDVSQVQSTLASSSDKTHQQLAKIIPDFQTLLNDKSNGPVLRSALLRFQKYVSHSDQHGMDLYQSLQQMALPSKSDPRNPKQMIPNPDAQAAQVIAGAFGNGNPQHGWSILQTYHEAITPQPIKNAAEAESIATDPTSTPSEIARAKAFLAADTANKASVARAGAEAREAAKPQAPPASGTPDALGFVPTVGSQKESDTRFRSFKKNLDALSQSEQSYAQFQQALSDINTGNWTGADSVVALFNAIGLSAAPLAGRGFRVNENTIREHEHARGWEGALQAKLQGVSTGAVITPQQLRDYASIASQARSQQIIATANQMHAAGISADAALPTGNGRRIDADTARIFLTLANNDPNKARQAASAKGWTF